MGLSRWEGLQYGYYAMRPDIPLISHEPAGVGHAEAVRRGETPQEALQATETFIRESFRSSSMVRQGEGFHATQDVPRHRGERWPPTADTLLESVRERIKHYWRDAFPSPGEINEAYYRTLQGFRQILGRRK